MSVSDHISQLFRRRLGNRKRNSNNNAHHPDWSSFGYDVTKDILKKLDITDLTQCIDVCKSWRSISQTLISSLPINSPVLLLSKQYVPDKLFSKEEIEDFLLGEEDYDFFFKDDRSEPTQLYCFFNPVTSKLYKLSNQSKELVKERSFVGSSNGWTLFKGVVDLVMFNPSIGVTIRVPCTASDLSGIEKAVLWGDPILDMRKRNNSHGILAVNSGLHYGVSCANGLSFAICGDTRFRDTLQDQVFPYDVTYFNGLVYAVFSKGFIQAWDFNQMETHCVRGSGVTPRMVENYQPSFNSGKELPSAWYCELHLVDSSGELWLVSKLGFGFGFAFGNSMIFGVYKMDFKERKWVDLDSLGDQAVFLCGNQCIAFSPQEPSRYKRNCIYFEDKKHIASLQSCIYVYNLEGGPIEKVRF